MNDITVSVDLRAQFGPVRNQGPRPTCMAFAASDVHAGLRNGWAALSCEYVFYHAQRRAGRPPNLGALLSSMLEAVCDDGQPEESGWPYLSATPIEANSWMPPAEVGTLYGRNGEKFVHALDRVIGELDQRRPLIILLTLSSAFYAPNPLGVVNPAGDEKAQPERRHAVAAVGHGTVDGQRAILVRNSWSQTWGMRDMLG